VTPSIRKGAQFQKLPVAWEHDSQIMTLSPQAELLFLRMISLCNSVQSYGRLSAAQVRLCARGLRNLRSACAELVSAELLSANTDLTEYHVNERTRWFLDEPMPNVSTYKPEAKTAGQKASAPKSTDNGLPRGGARVKREREIEREEGRTPSGSVRPSSAQAAPRGTGGATQPAPNPEVPEVPEVGTMSGAEARAAIRETLNKAKQSVSGSTGKDTKFSKYDPDRPITPINSAMASGWTAE
jgi:hypothetical protein